MSGNTPIWSFPYPVATDSPDVPRDMLALATAIDKKAQLRVVANPTDVPNADRYVGMIVLATTTLLLYRWSGSAWLSLGSDTPAAVSQLTGTQSISNSADTDVAWSNTAEENWTDPITGLAMVDGTNNSRLNIRRDGLYLCGFTLMYQPNATVGGKRVATMTRNNTGAPTNASAIAYDSSRFNTAADVTALSDSNPVRLAAGDILRLSTWQNSGVSQNVFGTAIEGKSRMWAVWQKP